MFCMDIFAKQEREYQMSVLLPGVPTLSVEAASPHGWSKYSHAQISMERFGASAPAKDLFKKFCFTPENVEDKVNKIIAFYSGGAAPDLWNVPVF